MRGWALAVVLGAGWVATCLESRRRFEEDGKALRHAREGLLEDVDPFTPYSTAETRRARAAAHVAAALEARGRRGTFS